MYLWIKDVKEKGLKSMARGKGGPTGPVVGLCLGRCRHLGLWGGRKDSRPRHREPGSLRRAGVEKRHNVVVTSIFRVSEGRSSAVVAHGSCGGKEGGVQGCVRQG